MKRTLLALALLLGTTGLFAQVGMRMSEQQMPQKTVKNNIERQVIKGKKNVNLSTKDGAREVLCDFSNPDDYTF
jgi:hypothetical protein